MCLEVAGACGGRDDGNLQLKLEITQGYKSSPKRNEEMSWKEERKYSDQT
jgi:hypothetical protein